MRPSQGFVWLNKKEKASAVIMTTQRGIEPIRKIVKLVYLGESPDLNDLIEQALSQSNFQVIALASDKVDLEAIADLTPTMMVMDLRHLGSPNWKMHDKIRESHTMGHLPILVITDSAQRYDHIPGLISTRLDDYISYPFEPSTFQLVVEQLLSRTQIGAKT